MLQQLQDEALVGLKDFDLVKVIGRGSYAKVFVVTQKRTGRIYAMKVIKKELVNDDEVGPPVPLPFMNSGLFPHLTFLKT